MRILVLILVLILGTAGCVSLPANPTNMTPAQLKAWVADKNANISCGVINSPYGRGVGVYVVLDKGIVVNGTVTVDSECKVTITNTPAVSK